MIYDCFLFLNEFDVLDFRLKLHGPIVDKFIILESDITFAGNSRKLLFQNSYEYDIDYYVYDDRKNFYHPMEREKSQREYLKQCVINSGITKNDYCIVSDVDEIYETESLNDLLHKHDTKPIRGYLYHNEFYSNVFRIHHRNTYLNPWFGPYLNKFSSNISFQQTRDVHEFGFGYEHKFKHYDIVHDFCGYHLSNLFGDDWKLFVYKLTNFGHALEKRNLFVRQWSSENDYRNYIDNKIKNNILKINNEYMNEHWLNYDKYIYHT